MIKEYYTIELSKTGGAPSCLVPNSIQEFKLSGVNCLLTFSDMKLMAVIKKNIKETEVPLLV